MAYDVLNFDIGIAMLSEYDRDGFPTVQIDAYGEKLSGAEPYELHSVHGIVSRPHDPDTDSDGNPGLGCQVLFANEGGRGHAWLCSDPRVIPLLPPVKKGGFASYGGKLKNPAFHYVDGDTGSTTFYVPYRIENDVAQRAMTIELNVENENEESLSIIHGSGAAVTISEKDGKVSTVIKNQKGDAYIEVNDDGVVVNGQLVVNGALHAGGLTGGFPMVNGTALVAFLQKLMAVISSINVSFSQGAAIAPLATELASILSKNTKGV